MIRPAGQHRADADTVGSVIYRGVVRPGLLALSRRDPEVAHEWLIQRLAMVARHPGLTRLLAMAAGASRPEGGREVFGLRFPNPIGLAAGFDKNGAALPALAALGFGFLEAGTVTRHPQRGQPRPRIWRYAGQQALINAMGFPNWGADAVAALQAVRPQVPVPVGWNLSKSMTTPLEETAEDICASLRALHPYADYFVVNVSSPNTPGLRDLHGRRELTELLHAVGMQARRLAASAGLTRARPVLLKISPDLQPAQLDSVIEVAVAAGIAGIIATNTTLERGLVSGAIPDRGGVSGRPLHTCAVSMVRHLVAELDGRLPVVGVGGISSPETALRMLDVGASLVQIFTGLIFEGPWLIRRLRRATRSWSSTDGVTADVAYNPLRPL